jgi:hypothetical protein
MNFLNEITMNQISLHRQTRQQRQAAGMQAFVLNALTSPKASYWSALFISSNDSYPIEGSTGSLEGSGYA